MLDPLRNIDAEYVVVKLEGLLAAYAQMQIAATQSGAPDLKAILEDRSLTMLSKTCESVIPQPLLLAAGGATPEIWWPNSCALGKVSCNGHVTLPTWQRRHAARRHNACLIGCAPSLEEPASDGASRL